VRWNNHQIGGNGYGISNGENWGSRTSRALASFGPRTRGRFIGKIWNRSQAVDYRRFVGSLPPGIVAAVEGNRSRGGWGLVHVLARKRILLTNGRPKNGSVPFPRGQGDSPIFAAIEPIRQTTSVAPRKLGQSPVTVVPSLGELL
jgi:hypothetical protein